MVRLPAKRLWACFAFLIAAPVAGGQKPSAIPLIPAADWRVSTNEKMDLDAVRKFGGDPDIEREYGVDSIELRTYQSGANTVSVIAEPSTDASTAYGLFTYYRTDSMATVAGLPLTATGSNMAMMARGRYFFRIVRPAGAPAQVSDNDFLALLFLLAHSHPPGEAKVILPNTLPQKGLIPGSEKYLLGEASARRVLPSLRTDLIGFSEGAEVQMGDYSVGKGRATVLVISYPTPQIARARYGEMKKLIAENQDAPVYAKRLASFVILVLHSDSASEATSLMGMFTLSGRVTTDQRYPGDKSIPVQMMELIVANLIFVGVVSLMAVGGGLLVFAWKQYSRRWSPQNQWGERDEAALITLNLKLG